MSLKAADRKASSKGTAETNSLLGVAIAMLA
jgi:hypothetical protein